MAEAPAPLDNPLRTFDDTYMAIFDNIEGFFRFEKRHPDAMPFDDDYYARAAEVMKKRLDFELEHLRHDIIK